ncbi:hypothetical protein G647_03525 [Cladophialophora carrionii CBS 160.54]|uniref:Transcription factor domain-containing protein n=1 Tax=Cladophialophora carrionii CBS 160.54 TaxID=1279043 RepID=V9DBT0_9EURO|nr:uncharacterized protein G647_03525 [Cladophialophora carrionii CBS 160.54]ETI24156.1 hypothetical protein G647_03525 [Cladophialophora carrionii CBS 160.54]
MMDSFVDDKALVLSSSNSAWNFWSTLVIQASREQACVRYSLVALSSLHESIELTKRAPWQNHTFTLYYTKAITEINQSQNSLPLDIILISCLLFAHCDFLMGASAAGLTHLKSGHRIIKETRKRQIEISPEVADLVEPIMHGFLAKTEAYALREQATEPSTAGPVTTAATYSLPDMPEKFEDLAHANKHLQQAVYLVLLLERGKPHHSTPMVPGVRKYVAEWSKAFGRWRAEASLDRDDPILKDWQLLLLAHHRMAFLVMKTFPPENDNAYIRAAADFRIMFAQLRTFLRSGHTTMDKSRDSDIVLKAHLGFISPLYFIATTCRVRDVRRNALEALQELKVVEAHWNSCVAYAVAKTVVEIEESCSQSSMKVQRIKVDSVDRCKDGTLEIRYHQIPGNGNHGDTVTRRITEPCCHHEATMTWPLVRIVQLHGFQATVKPHKLNCSCEHTLPT